MKNVIDKNQMLVWAKDLFPICRSITGNGLLDTLKYIKQIHKDLSILKFKTGTKVFDWVIPNEWNIRDAYIEHESGKRYAEFSKNNLHIMNYSIPVTTIMNLNELKLNIYSDKDKPKWIPYITSYYKKQWGFCMSYNDKNKLPKGNYKIVIDSTLKKGNLCLGELLIKGKSKKEILISTYVCHPSMANNEISGPVVSISLINYIKNKYKNKKYSYRFIFVPETIGSITYLSKNLKKLKKHVIAGFVLSCVGDERGFSIVHSPSSNTLADQALLAALIGKDKVRQYSYLDRGSDERQYCAPGVDLPVAGFCRTKYGEYKEYHTSGDDFSVVTKKGLNGSFDVMKSIIDSFEIELNPRAKVICEPQLSKRGLYTNTGSIKRSNEIKLRCDLLAYSNGIRNIFEIAKLFKCSLSDINDELILLKKNKLLD